MYIFLRCLLCCVYELQCVYLCCFRYSGVPVRNSDYPPGVYVGEQATAAREAVLVYSVGCHGGPAHRTGHDALPERQQHPHPHRHPHHEPPAHLQRRGRHLQLRRQRGRSRGATARLGLYGRGPAGRDAHAERTVYNVTDHRAAPLQHEQPIGSAAAANDREEVT